MNCTEDQFRSILREEAADITPESVPPLRPAGTSPVRLRARGSRGRRWLVPLGAAAAVTAITVAATFVGGASAPEPASTRAGLWHGVARYFLVLEQDILSRKPAQLEVRNTATGAVVATAPIPKGDDPFTVAANGPSDRSFVLAGAAANGDGQYFLARFSPARKTITFRLLPVTGPSPTAIAVSPDGSELAVLDYRYPQLETEIRIYSLSGTLLRTWRCRDVVGLAAGVPEFAWGPDGTLAFIYHGQPSTDDGIRLLQISAPSGDLLRASRLSVRVDQPGGYQIGSFLMTGRGTMVLAQLVRSPSAAHPHQAISSELVVYSARNGRELRSFWAVRGIHDELAWSNPSGGPPVVWAPPKIAKRWIGLGVLNGTRFFPIPISSRLVLGTVFFAVAF
jgi:hypothetical protein